DHRLHDLVTACSAPRRSLSSLQSSFFRGSERLSQPRIARAGAARIIVSLLARAREFGFGNEIVVVGGRTKTQHLAKALAGSRNVTVQDLLLPNIENRVATRHAPISWIRDLANIL